MKELRDLKDLTILDVQPAYATEKAQDGCSERGERGDRGSTASSGKGFYLNENVPFKFRALSGRLKFTVRRHKFNEYSLLL